MSFLESKVPRVDGSYRSPRFGTRHKLKAVLAVGDVLAIVLSYSLSGLGTGYAARQGLLRTVIMAAVSVVAGLWALRSQGLYLSRVSAPEPHALLRCWPASCCWRTALVISTGT
jgi:hypothetical protein